MEWHYSSERSLSVTRASEQSSLVNQMGRQAALAVGFHCIRNQEAP